MNKILTVLAMLLGAMSLSIAFTKNIFLLFLILLGSLLIIIIGYIVEREIEKNGNKFINKIIHIFSKSNGKYIIDSKIFTYRYISKQEMWFEKRYELISKQNALEGFEDRYCWSAPATGAVILPIVKEQSVENIIKRETWTCFNVDFGRIIRKNEKVTTGVKIENLIDNQNLSVPFLSATIDIKTKLLVFNIKIPRELKPKNIKLRIYSLSNDKEELKSMDLAYDNSRQCIHTKIFYPRKGWRYVVSWDF